MAPANATKAVGTAEQGTTAQHVADVRFVGADRTVLYVFDFLFQAEDGIRDVAVTGVQTCALPISALGAALRAFHGEQVAQGREIGWEEVVAGFVEPVARVRPDPSSVAVYAGLKPVYAACEAHALGRGPDPTPLVEAFRSGLDPD